jgi:hypothetical protein
MLSYSEAPERGSRMSARPRSRKAPPARSPGSPNAGRTPRRSLGWLIELVRHAWQRRAETAPSLAAARIEPAGESAEPEAIPLLVQQCTELRARLVVHDPAIQVVRHLFAVHDELRANGWTGVEALPAKIIGRALTETEIMSAEEPSHVLDTILLELRRIKEAAEARAEIEAHDREWETMQVPEVMDSDFGEFELAERSWAGTVPNGLELPTRSA